VLCCESGFLPQFWMFIESSPLTLLRRFYSRPFGCCFPISGDPKKPPLFKLSEKSTPFPGGCEQSLELFFLCRSCSPARCNSISLSLPLRPGSEVGGVTPLTIEASTISPQVFFCGRIHWIPPPLFFALSSEEVPVFRIG